MQISGVKNITLDHIKISNYNKAIHFESIFQFNILNSVFQDSVQANTALFVINKVENQLYIKNSTFKNLQNLDGYGGAIYVIYANYILITDSYWAYN